MNQLPPITSKQVNMTIYLLNLLRIKDYETYMSYTNYPLIKNDFTWFLKQFTRGYVYDCNIAQGDYMIKTLIKLLNV